MRGRLRDRVELEANRQLRERLERLRSALEDALTSAAEPLRFPLTPGEWGAASGAAQLHLIRDAVDAISRHETQREILSALIDAAAAIYPRIVLFILKGGTLTGWSGLGFLGEGGFRSEQVPGLTLHASGQHLPARAAAGRTAARATTEGPGEEVRSALGGVQPADSCAVPVLVRGRPVAILYGDTGSAADRGDPFAFEVLARVAGLAMERLAAPHRRARADAEAPAAGREGAQPAARPSGTATPPEDAELQAILADLGGGHLRSPSADDGLGDEERRRQADARRFAHLLVSELLLYHEAAVIQGRKHRDLYARLRKEIDRSRQAFQSRFPTLSAGPDDFFGQELVRTLAQGNPAILGN